MWTDVTKDGMLLGPNAFRIEGLCAGATYSFRVRQRNAKGWSSFSRACRLVTTLSACPPSRPVVVDTAAKYALATWISSPQGMDSLSLTAIDFEMQQATLPIQFGHQGDKAGDMKKMAPEICWSSALFRFVDLEKDTEEIDDIKEGEVKVLVDMLSPATSYILRVRARTIAGWSRWSPSSEIFKTMSGT